MRINLPVTPLHNSGLLLLIIMVLSGGHLSGQSTNLDVNKDGELNILVLGTTRSISGQEAFTPHPIANELQSILQDDDSISLEVNVVSEDIYRSQPVLIGLGGSGTEYTYTHFSHSLCQYYFWPDGRDDRLLNLTGDLHTAWDFVVIGADPHMVATLPGYYSLGVNKIANRVVKGGAKPLLFMIWPRDDSQAAIEHFEEMIYRTAEGATVDLPVIPAGLAWHGLQPAKKDVSAIHPTPNGAYVAAAAIYSHLMQQSAVSSNYDYDDAIADKTHSTVAAAAGERHFDGCRAFVSPFIGCEVVDDVINYNHTGTSSERGILNGLNWIFDKAPESLQNGGPSPIDFNFGRANSNFEPNKRYKVDTTKFDFSFGFPMQDHGNHGNVSMLYGLDSRQSGTLNDTDVGVARFMVEQGEMPFARAVPIRTLYAQMKDAIPGQSAYRDSWHMHRDLDKASAAFMYTLLTGNCVLEEEPQDSTSSAWKSWMSHKIGYETAWNLMYLEGRAKGCESLSLVLTASPDIGGIVDGAGNFQYAEMVNLKATPETGYSFINWTKNGIVLSTEAELLYKVTDHAELTANFGIISDANSDFQKEVKFYPNPTDDRLIISGYSGSIKIVNLNGMIVWEGSMNNELKMDISDFERGTYFIQGKGFQRRLIITR